MIHGKKVLLRAPCTNDEAALMTLRNDVALQMLLMSQPRPNTPARVRKWMEAMSEDTHSVFFVIESKGNVCGYLQIVRMNFLHGTGELGICLAEGAQGKGIAAEVITLIELYVREVFNLRKLNLQVLSSNIRAIRFYEKCDFRTVGVLQQHFYQKGDFLDVTLMEKILSARVS